MSAEQDSVAVTTEQNVDGLYPAVGKKICIGVIYNGDPETGTGYSYAHWAGIKKMQKQLGLTDSQIISRSSISESDDTAIEEAFHELIQAHCNIIFATSVGFMDICRTYAMKYPDTVFAVCSGTQSNGSNLVNYFGRLYEARYLSGMIAGMNTKTDRVGFVAAKGLKSSEVTGSVNAFALGVNAVNKKCRVLVCCTESWNDPDAETAAAEQLMDGGCDILAQHCDSPATQLAAARAGIMGIGYNSDMQEVAPHSVLTSVVWDWSVYYTDAVEKIMNGTWKGYNYYGGIQDGLVNITDPESFGLPGGKEKIEQARADILSGKLKIFSGELKTNDGQIRGKSGKVMSETQIRKRMNWYYQNVESVNLLRK
jgi:basic membrane protein A